MDGSCQKQMKVNGNSGFSLMLRIAEIALQLMHWCKDNLTSSAGKLHRRHHHMTEILLKAVQDIIQSKRIPQWSKYN